MLNSVRRKIYHIVHVDKLASIIADRFLLSDAELVQRSGGTVIGMSTIKQRRLALPVTCHTELCVGGCVPFYFCPRSIMLYVIHRANHPELTYQGGQGPILHLEADLQEAVDWADRNSQRWAFSLSNAGARYVQFRSSLDELAEINWQAVAATDFRSYEISEGKQAEFLVERMFPWTLVRRIGVRSHRIAADVTGALEKAEHRPVVEVKPSWYY